MTVAYPYGDSLYVNITNHCPNRCSFCVRTQADGFYAENLWLEREPTQGEILFHIFRAPCTAYSSLVFCGYGEPTERLEDMIAVCHAVKGRYPGFPIRLNTNGLSDKINGRSTARELEGAIDILSISLNAPDAETYNALCHPIFGEEAFPAILAFASEAKKYVPTVIFTAVKDTLPGGDADLERCRALAESLGIPLRVRDYIKTEK